MSMRYETLHALAATYKPDLPIKSTSTWVAILLHEIANLEAIQAEKDFLWVKCHGRVTIKTLKHYYWSRYPVGDISLIFDRTFPSDRTTMSELRVLQKQQHPKLDKKNENIIVLRALDEESAEHERHLIAELDLKNSMRKSVGVEESIAVSDNENEPGHEHDIDEVQANGASNASNSDDESGREEQGLDMNAQYSTLGAYTSGSANIGPPIKSEPDRSSASNSDTASDETPKDVGMNGDAAEAIEQDTSMTDNESEDKDNDQLDPASAPALPQPIFVSLTALSSPLRRQLLTHTVHTCASPYCQRQMTLQPWTRFHHTTLAPLCTECTRVFLRDPLLNSDADALREMERQVRAQRREKKRRRRRGGVRQNMSEDAGLDWGGGVLRGPVGVVVEGRGGVVRNGFNDGVDALSDEDSFADHSDRVRLVHASLGDEDVDEGGGEGYDYDEEDDEEEEEQENEDEEEYSEEEGRDVDDDEDEDEDEEDEEAIQREQMRARNDTRMKEGTYQNDESESEYTED